MSSTRELTDRRWSRWVSPSIGGLSAADSHTESLTPAAHGWKRLCL